LISNFTEEDILDIGLALSGHLQITKSNFTFILESLLQLECKDFLNKIKEKIIEEPTGKWLAFLYCNNEEEIK
jgi:hypothetical protein